MGNEELFKKRIFELVSVVHDLIEKSDKLLLQQEMSSNELKDYKQLTNSIFARLMKEGLNNTITEISLEGLKFKVTKINNPVLRWLYDMLRSKGAITFNAPFLVRHSESDYSKRYVFWIKMKLEGLLFNLNALISSKL